MRETAARLAVDVMIEAKMERRNASAKRRFRPLSAARKLAGGLMAGWMKGMVLESIARTSPLLGGRAPRMVVVVDIFGA